MILAEHQIHSKTITPIIGTPKRFIIKYLRPMGSTSFFLISFSQKRNDFDELRINSKCNFQLYTDGLLLKTNFSNQVRAIPIKYSDIIELRLIRGKEHIDPLPFSLMGILLKLGVSVLTARYFKAEIGEYTIEDTILELRTSDYSINLMCNGYLFESQEALLNSTQIDFTVVIN